MFNYRDAIISNIKENFNNDTGRYYMLKATRPDETTKRGRKELLRDKENNIIYIDEIENETDSSLFQLYTRFMWRYGVQR